MAGPDRRGSIGHERRESLQLPMQQPDDDEYALAAMGISDGFRPSNISTTHPYQPSSMPYTPPTPTLLSPKPPRPLSITKPKQADQFALQHDGAMGHVSGGSSTVDLSSTTSTNSRHTPSMSSASDLYTSEDEPYRGPTQPSHAYQAYAQESSARPLSLATTVVRSERSYQGPTGPTHPYGMYPQNTAPESVSGRGVPPSVPTVGFPGRNNDYQRRLGPDGEEMADIIGPDGHTEPLPPYTKYPDEAFARKARLRSTVPEPIEGAGGMGLATRNPEFSSREDLSSTNSRGSIRTVSTIRQETASNASVLESGPSEKKELKRWQQSARKKVCGIVPLWAIILAVTTLVCFAIILGVTLYVLKPKPSSSSINNGTTPGAQMFDAIPITSLPSNLPILPTGIYALPIGAPFAAQSSCLINTAQSKSWSCSMPASPLQMEIREIPGAKDQWAKKEIILDYGVANVTEFPFGTQPPVLNDAYAMSLVTDLHDPTRGPAWFFHAIYNKIVIVPEDLLSSPYDKRDLDESNIDKRYGEARHQDELPTTADFVRKGVAQIGSTPWFCYWNGTLLEAFLYVNQTSSEAAHAASHLTSSGLAATPTVSSATKTSGYAIATATATANSTDTSFVHDGRWGPEHEMLTGYPKVLKFLERRVPQGAQAIPPYCKKRVIVEDGTAQDLRNSTGGLILIYLNEVVSDTLNPIKRSIQEAEAAALETKVFERELPKDDKTCGCIWLGS